MIRNRGSTKQNLCANLVAHSFISDEAREILCKSLPETTGDSVRYIWIVEEDKDSASLYSSIIETEGFLTRHFSHYSEVPASGREQVAGLFFNAHLRDLKSLEFLKDFSASAPGCKIVATYGGLKGREKKLADYCWKTLPKPFCLEEFTAILAEIRKSIS